MNIQKPWEKTVIIRRIFILHLIKIWISKRNFERFKQYEIRNQQQ